MLACGLYRLLPCYEMVQVGKIKIVKISFCLAFHKIIS